MSNETDNQGAPDLFGDSGTRYSGNPDAYAGRPGEGPKGKTCADCTHFERRIGGYFKCGLIRATRSEATDIRAGTPACEKFKGETDE